MYIIRQQNIKIYSKWLGCSIMNLKIMIKLPCLISYYHVTR